MSLVLTSRILGIWLPHFTLSLPFWQCFCLYKILKNLVDLAWTSWGFMLLFGFLKITFFYEFCSFPVRYSHFGEEELWLTLQISQPPLSKSSFWVIFLENNSLWWQIPLCPHQWFGSFSSINIEDKAQGAPQNTRVIRDSMCYCACAVAPAFLLHPAAEDCRVRDICWGQGACDSAASLGQNCSFLKAGCGHNTEVFVLSHSWANDNIWQGYLPN